MANPLLQKPKAKQFDPAQRIGAPKHRTNTPANRGRQCVQNAKVIDSCTAPR